MGLFGGDIQLCPSGGDVELCLERDIELCTTCPVLTLTGDDEPVVGTEYTATGGAGDLSFSFDKGSISITSTTPATTTEPRKVVATITAIDPCGDPGTSRVGVVRVEDSCQEPQSAQIHVKLPGGQYVEYREDYRGIFTVEEYQSLESVYILIGQNCDISEMQWCNVGCYLTNYGVCNCLCWYGYSADQWRYFSDENTHDYFSVEGMPTGQMYECALNYTVPWPTGTLYSRKLWNSTDIELVATFPDSGGDSQNLPDAFKIYIKYWYKWECV